MYQMKVVMLIISACLTLSILGEQLHRLHPGGSIIACAVRFVMTILLVCGLITAMHLK
jgi:hypothetical protein